VKDDIKDRFQDDLICKTPAWVIAHCLEHLLISGKKYTLNNCDLLELAKASDGAYVIVGYLIMKKRHVKIKDIDQNVALGPLINYVLEDSMPGKKKQPPNVMSCIVYILPSTLHYLFPMVAANCPLLKLYLEVTHDSSMSEFIPLEPLPATDLMIKRSSGEPAKGGLSNDVISFCISY